MYTTDYLQETGPNTGWGWLSYLVIGLLLSLVIVSWLLRRRKGEELEASPGARGLHKENVEVDDLTRIEGIGPKVARVLNESGISTFDALANADAAEVQQMLRVAGLQMMKPKGWIEQAQLAANGDWTALEQLQGKLEGGRRK
ncbi:MAG: DUF4332 domain-containing protein [Chloroflexota bacterium]